MHKWLLLTILFSVSSCTDPIIGLPGGALKGEVASPPASWDSVPDVIQVEFRPSDPYSINIWAVTVDGELYIATRDTKWVPFIADDNRVRVRIEDTVYELEASTVEGNDNLQELANAYSAKYDYAMSDSDNQSGFDAYHLDTRN